MLEDMEANQEMETLADFRNWDELIPDVLGVIFTYLNLQEKLTLVPSVCKAWANAMAGPYCWKEIDIEDWSNRCEPDQLDRMVEMLITRSAGSLRKLCVSRIQTEGTFTFIAENAPSLHSLKMPRCSLNDSVVENLSKRLSMLSFLDLSYCVINGARAIELIGKNCKLLEGLCRNMHPIETEGKPFEDDEAYAIASSMPMLKHLELAYHLIDTDGVRQILSSCHKLEFLDLRGCWAVSLEDIPVGRNFPKVKILGPHVPDDDEGDDDWDDDISEESHYLAWEFLAGHIDEFYDDESDIDDGMWDDEGRLEELEFRFYQGIEDAGMNWPPSP
ncbi:hypothetical protein RIF29_16908 [Crotalaria pallida]|uniref:F-box protein n=1 Tax=Crotalaria pallida TaxID=3830 RepID=A0AAN9IK56_CROPI